MRGRGGLLLAGALLVVAGVAGALYCRTHHHIEDGILAMGVGLLAAWLVVRPHPTGRFLASGAVLSGVGGPLVLLRVTGEQAYDEAGLLAGAALALLLLAEVRGADIRRGLVALLAVAASLAALTGLPSRINAPDVWLAFEQGTGFCIALAAYGVLVLGAVVLPGRQGR